MEERVKTLMETVTFIQNASVTDHGREKTVRVSAKII